MTTSSRFITFQAAKFSCLEDIFATSDHVRAIEPLKPRLRVTGVNKGYTDAEFLEEVFNQNPSLRSELTEQERETIKIVGKKPCRNLRRETWILEAEPGVFKKIVKKGTIYFDLETVYIEEYLDALMCYKCYRFGHKAQRCKEQQDTCYYRHYVTLNQNKELRLLRKAPKAASAKDVLDFSKVGGLRHHIKTLREVIIFPLLHGHIFSHFNIKAPRGVLFYGPPGTGKTLRKGADMLEKWVGESEKKLRALFEKAAKCRPSIIFFDEIDGLAPIRSDKNDHIHSSLVATLLALMDGLDTKPGTWDQQLTPTFTEKLADLTAGFCGADIQALCSEAVLCCVKRHYPKINNTATKVKIEADSLKVEEADFLEAKMNIVPSTVKQGHKMRNLSHIIKPLLKRQQNRVHSIALAALPTRRLQIYTWEKRYAGRILLIGSNIQGLNTHLIPSILKHLEHLPTFVFDSKIFHKMKMNLASAHIVSTLEDIHAGLPVLTIASCTTDVPSKFHNFFYNNSTILIKIDDPTDEEREHFLAPLFFGEKCMSLHRVLENCKRSVRKVKPEVDTLTKSKKGNSEELKIEEVHSLTNGKRKSDDYTINDSQKAAESSSNESQIRFEEYQARKRYFTRVLSDLLNQRSMWKNCSR
nr:unnamed protein product [Callosobruchus analis]